MVTWEWKATPEPHVYELGHAADYDEACAAIKLFSRAFDVQVSCSAYTSSAHGFMAPAIHRWHHDGEPTILCVFGASGGTEFHSFTGTVGTIYLLAQPVQHRAPPPSPASPHRPLRQVARGHCVFGLGPIIQPFLKLTDEMLKSSDANNGSSAEGSYTAYPIWRETL